VEYLTVQEAEEQTGVSAQTLRAMLRDGVIEGYEQGGLWVIPAEAVDTLEDQVAVTGEAIESGENEPDEDDGEDEDDVDVYENPEDNPGDDA